MKTVSNFLSIAIIAGLVGCVTVKSNVRADEIPNFKRVLVVTKMRNASEQYVERFRSLFPAGYEVCTLPLSPLSFDNPDEAIQKKAYTCQSDVILTLGLVRPGTAGRYNSTPYEYDADMKSVTTGQSFWKAIIAADPTYGEQVPPRSILKRLINDHIITGKIRDIQ